MTHQLASCEAEAASRIAERLERAEAEVAALTELVVALGRAVPHRARWPGEGRALPAVGAVTDEPHRNYAFAVWQELTDAVAEVVKRHGLPDELSQDLAVRMLLPLAEHGLDPHEELNWWAIGAEERDEAP